MITTLGNLNNNIILLIAAAQATVNDFLPSSIECLFRTLREKDVLTCTLINLKTHGFKNLNLLKITYVKSRIKSIKNLMSKPKTQVILPNKPILIILLYIRKISRLKI